MSSSAMQEILDIPQEFFVYVAHCRRSSTAHILTTFLYSEMGRTLSIAARSLTGESLSKSAKLLVRTRPFNVILRALSDTLSGMGFSMSSFVCLVLGQLFNMK